MFWYRGFELQKDSYIFVKCKGVQGVHKRSCICFCTRSETHDHLHHHSEKVFNSKHSNYMGVFFVLEITRFYLNL